MGAYWWSRRRDGYAHIPWSKRKVPTPGEPGWTGYWLSLYLGSWVFIVLGIATALLGLVEWIRST
jgi:hypothetical protein